MLFFSSFQVFLLFVSTRYVSHKFILSLSNPFLQPGDLEKAQLGLGHSYSRAKVKFNVNRVDNMVIQAIFLLDTLDKDVNSFAMRVRFVIDFYTNVLPALLGICIYLAAAPLIL
jgi:RNA processing factor Prp31